MKVMYGDMICDDLKSNNWKRMHGIPMKMPARSLYGGKVICLSDKYISKRSQKKKKKAHFQNCLNPIVEEYLCDKPALKRFYHRYGYMRKKYRHKIPTIN